MQPQTLFDKIWNQHVVADLGEGYALLHVDRNLLHELSGTAGLEALSARTLSVSAPALHLAVPDHVVSTAPGRVAATTERSADRVGRLKAQAARHGIRFIDINDPNQGIVHVIGPELGFTLPGTLVTCGDSHTSTHGALGALAFGIGSSEIAHVLATGTLVQKRPATLRIALNGHLGPGVAPKDVILHVIGVLGAGGGNGCAVEYAGDAIARMDIESRLTVCNMSIEFGAKVGMIAPDATTLAYLRGRAFAPEGAAWDVAAAHWATLRTDDGATFDRDITIDASAIAPQITWGTSPEHTMAIDEVVPGTDGDDGRAAAAAYMGVVPGIGLEGVPVDHVFIGSCTNGRLSDLESAARVVRGRSVPERVTAWVVPGSQRVKREAEARGLDQIFAAAGFSWREPGCSSCVAVNAEVVAPGARAVSTTNRNFVGRQGPGARTHLASPAMAAAAAVTGCITDVRKLGEVPTR
ncbi:MAG: 3-isopropylmalate dehydratase large subunit [Pseudomonadota bacterium]